MKILESLVKVGEMYGYILDGFRVDFQVGNSEANNIPNLHANREKNCLFVMFTEEGKVKIPAQIKQIKGRSGYFILSVFFYDQAASAMPFFQLKRGEVVKIEIIIKPEQELLTSFGIEKQKTQEVEKKKENEHLSEDEQERYNVGIKKVHVLIREFAREWAKNENINTENKRKFSEFVKKVRDSWIKPVFKSNGLITESMKDLKPEVGEDFGRMEAGIAVLEGLVFDEKTGKHYKRKGEENGKTRKKTS